MALASMKQSPEEAKESNACTSEPREYPWGLELSLNEEVLAKLGLTAPPAVGTTMMITAKVTVTSASQYQREGGEQEMSSCWQVTDMECSSAQGDQAAKATALYG